MRVEKFPEVRVFIEQTGAPHFENRFRLLDNSLASVTIEGLCLEFGVHKGVSLKYIADRILGKIYGFDCFSGIDEDWTPHYRRGHFKLENLPDIAPNAELVVGKFQEILEPFLEAYTEPIAFAHLDADLHSSTVYVLKTLAEYERIVPGTILQFDELFWKEGDTLYDDEFRAWTEFAEVFQPKVKWLGYCGSRGENIEGAKFALRILCLKPSS